MPRNIESGAQDNSEDKEAEKARRRQQDLELQEIRAGAGLREAKGEDSVTQGSGSYHVGEPFGAPKESETEIPEVKSKTMDAEIETLKNQIEETGPVDDAIARGPQIPPSSRDAIRQRGAEEELVKFRAQQQALREREAKETLKPKEIKEQPIKKAGWLKRLFGGK